MSTNAKTTAQIKMLDDVYWVGAIDWSVRQFHGYNTEEGSSYNSYLIMDDEPTLIDTVKASFADEMLERVKATTTLESIKYIVMNHAENDHSGALPIIIKQLPNAVIVTNKTCKENLLLLFPSLANYTFKVIANDIQLKLGKNVLQFVQVPLLHWPDSMMTYCAAKKTLFSNDGFGQHLACSERWTDQLQYADHVFRLMHEYNANILGPFQPQIKAYLPIVLKLDIQSILTAHGCSWRGGLIARAVGEYQIFGDNKQLQNKASIYFDSMSGETRAAAAHISADANVPISFLDLKVNTLTKCALSAYDCKYLAFLSPNLNNEMMPKMESCLQYLKGLKLLNKRKIVLVSCYCWSEKTIEQMRIIVEEGGGEVVGTYSFKLKFNEDHGRHLRELITRYWT